MSAAASHFLAVPCSSSARAHRRRCPEHTALYRLVAQHPETWLARRREGDSDAAPIPRHVESELRGYLECGILARGFARARCGDCGHDFLIAYPCRAAGCARPASRGTWPRPPPIAPAGAMAAGSRCTPPCASRPTIAPGPDPALPAAPRRRASIAWARLLARIYEIQTLTCPHCHGPMRLIAFLTDPASNCTILAHLGEPTTLPPLAPRARAPPNPEAREMHAAMIAPMPAQPSHALTTTIPASRSTQPRPPTATSTNRKQGHSHLPGKDRLNFLYIYKLLRYSIRAAFWSAGKSVPNRWPPLPFACSCVSWSVPTRAASSPCVTKPTLTGS